MVEIQIFAVEHVAAVLAAVLISFENIVSGEFDLLLGQAVKHDQHNDARHSNAERYRADAFGVGGLLGKIVPLPEIVRLKVSFRPCEDHLGVALEEQREGASCRADIHRLPQAVENQYLLGKEAAHAENAGR